MSFIFGGNTGTSYEDLISKRQRLEALQQANNAPVSNPYQQISRGIGRLGNAIFQSINDKRIAEQEAMQKQNLMQDFASLNTPALSGKMKSGMQGPPMPPEMVEQNRSEVMNNIMLNPALQRNPNANNVFQQIMRNKFAAQQPLTPYQQAQLKNQAMGYQLQADKLGADQNFRRDQLEAMNNYRMGQIGLQKSQLDLQRSNMIDRQMMQDYQNQLAQNDRNYKRQKNTFDMERGLSRDFSNNPLVKDHSTVEGAFSRIKAIQERGASGAGDMSLVFSYMKMLDPTSVVREGEYATAQNTEGVPSRILNLYNKAVDGQFLTPDQRNEFTGLAEDFYKKSLSNVQNYAKTFEPTINQYNLDKNRIFKLPNLYEKEKQQDFRQSNADYMNQPNNLVTGGEDLELQRLDNGEAVNPIADPNIQNRQIDEIEKRLETSKGTKRLKFNPLTGEFE